jgi:hypothetical protein
MSYPTSKNFYGVAIGTGTSDDIVTAVRDPTANDINYPLLQQWYNTTTEDLFILTTFTSSAGVVTATWESGGGSDVPTVFVTNSGDAIPSANTLNVLGGTGVSTTGSGDTITINALSTTPLMLEGNSGGAVSATANIINTVGTGSITIVGNPGTSTLTTELTGLTNHAVLVGAGTTTITKVGPSASTGQILQNNAAADPSYSTATYPSTTTINQILYSSANNVVGGLATANQGVLTTGTTGIPVITSLAGNGELIIGSTAGAPAAATLTAGTGITITNASNSITIAASGTQNLTVTPVNHAASPYTVLVTDDFLAVDVSGGVVTIKLPNAPTTGKVFVIKDSKGKCFTSNISVTTVGGVVTIDGVTTYTLGVNYESINVIFDGTSYEVF